MLLSLFIWDKTGEILNLLVAGGRKRAREALLALALLLQQMVLTSLFNHNPPRTSPTGSFFGATVGLHLWHCRGMVEDSGGFWKEKG